MAGEGMVTMDAVDHIGTMAGHGRGAVGGRTVKIPKLGVRRIILAWTLRDDDPREYD